MSICKLLEIKISLTLSIYDNIIVIDLYYKGKELTHYVYKMSELSFRNQL